jgi:hypothetical protein
MFESTGTEEVEGGVVADIAPLENRLLLFFPDYRCPHAVLASAKDRYVTMHAFRIHPLIYTPSHTLPYNKRISAYTIRTSSYRYAVTMWYMQSGFEELHSKAGEREEGREEGEEIAEGGGGVMERACWRRQCYIQYFSTSSTSTYIRISANGKPQEEAAAAPRSSSTSTGSKTKQQEPRSKQKATQVESVISKAPGVGMCANTCVGGQWPVGGGRRGNAVYEI